MNQRSRKTKKQGQTAWSGHCEAPSRRLSGYVAQLMATYPQRKKETLHYLSATPLLERSVRFCQVPADHLTLVRAKRSISFQTQASLDLPGQCQSAVTARQIVQRSANRAGRLEISYAAAGGRCQRLRYGAIVIVGGNHSNKEEERPAGRCRTHRKNPRGMKSAENNRSFG